MSTWQWAGVFFIFVVATMMCDIAGLSFIGGGEVSRLDTLLTPSTIVSSWGGLWDYIANAFDMFTFNYPEAFHGNLAFLRFILLPFGVACGVQITLVLANLFISFARLVREMIPFI